MARRRLPDPSTIEKIREHVRLQLKDAAITGLLDATKSAVSYEAFKKRWRRALLDRDVLLTETGRLEPHVNWLNGPFDVDHRFVETAKKGNRIAIEVLDELIVKRLMEGAAPSPEVAGYAAAVLRDGKPKLNRGPIGLNQRDQVIIWTLEWAEILGLGPTRNDATDTLEIPSGSSIVSEELNRLGIRLSPHTIADIWTKKRRRYGLSG